jgi:hypothetical protein
VKWSHERIEEEPIRRRAGTVRLRGTGAHDPRALAAEHSLVKALCALTDGNLSRQIQLLQEAALVEVWKGYRKNRPQTLIRMSESGRARFLEYIAELEKVVSNASGAAEAPQRVMGSLKGFSPA